jgi:hypothetical protein
MNEMNEKNEKNVKGKEENNLKQATFTAHFIYLLPLSATHSSTEINIHRVTDRE